MVARIHLHIVSDIAHTPLAIPAKRQKCELPIDVAALSDSTASEIRPHPPHPPPAPFFMGQRKLSRESKKRGDK